MDHGITPAPSNARAVAIVFGSIGAMVLLGLLIMVLYTLLANP